jgi:hypothetical protein
MATLKTHQFVRCEEFVGMTNFVEKWWTQMHKKASSVQVKWFSIFYLLFLGIKWCKMLNIWFSKCFCEIND